MFLIISDSFIYLLVQKDIKIDRDSYMSFSSSETSQFSSAVSETDQNKDLL